MLPKVGACGAYSGGVEHRLHGSIDGGSILLGGRCRAHTSPDKSWWKFRSRMHRL